MLKPKINIGIVYGHDSDLLNLAEEKIISMSKDGYRVKPAIINQDTLRRENGNIFKAIVEKFSDIDAAIIFMTPDDLAISVKDCESMLTANKSLLAQEFKNRLFLRSRQNVIYELGYVTGIVGEKKYRIFCPANIEIPSDIQGKYTERDLSHSNVTEVIEDFIVNNLSCFKRKSTLRDSAYVTDYSNVINDPTNSLDEFAVEFNALDSDDDKIFYLFERIVFNSYFDQPEWWYKRILEISSTNALQKNCIEILSGVLSYMGAWRPSPKKDEDVKDLNRIYNVKEKIKHNVNAIIGSDINPVILMVAYDYLGLSYNKLGRDEEFPIEKRLEFIINSEKFLKKTIEVATVYDDPKLPLWKGFAQFNLARTIHEKHKLEKSGDSVEWRRIFHEAIETRELWRTYHEILPNEVREGIDTEYHHAIAERLIRVALDNKGKSTETKPYKFRLDDIIKFSEKYEKWLKDPRQNRIRLATDVQNNWNIIRKNIEQYS